MCLLFVSLSLCQWYQPCCPCWPCQTGPAQRSGCRWWPLSAACTIPRENLWDWMSRRDKWKVERKKKKKITIYDYHWHFHLSTPKYDFMIAKQSSNSIVSSKDIFIVISGVRNIGQYFRGGGRVPILLICYSISIKICSKHIF